VNGITYEYTKRKENANWIERGKSYILTYSAKNPKVHNPVFTIEFESYAQLDSLTHRVGVEKIGSFWDANVNDAHVKVQN